MTLLGENAILKSRENHFPQVSCDEDGLGRFAQPAYLAERLFYRRRASGFPQRRHSMEVAHAVFFLPRDFKVATIASPPASLNAFIRRVEKIMRSLETNIGRVNDPLMTWIGAALIVAASALFVAAQFSISAVNGWWIDELFSLWASDVSFASFVRSASALLQIPTHHFITPCSIWFDGLSPMTAQQSSLSTSLQ
jgi:hypothetical protein